MSNLLQTIQTHGDTLARILGSIVLVWGAATTGKKGAVKLGHWIYRACTFQRDMRSAMTELFEQRASFRKVYQEDSARWNEASKEVTLINSILKNGISHRLAMQVAQAHLLMESEERPLFMCDELQSNVIVSLGYLKLLGLYNHSEIENINWQSVVYGELKADYAESFSLAVKAKTTMRAAVDFRNPVTGEHRGRWRVFAPCAQVNTALVFTGRFIPEDKVAINIAAEHGWSLR